MINYNKEKDTRCLGMSKIVNKTKCYSLFQ